MAPQPLNVKLLSQDPKQVLELVSPLFKKVSNINDQSFNPDALFTNVVSDIFTRSLRTFDPEIEFNLPDIQIDKTKPAQLEPPIALLKQLACQMRGTKREDLNHVEAYNTTKEILEKQLLSYPWNAKAVIVLSAFALEYGNIWNLYEQMMKFSSAVGGDSSLGYSLAVLNKVRVDTVNKKWDIPEYNFVVKDVFETVGLIVKLEWFINKYEGNNYPPPTLEKAKYERPCFVFWIILTIVVLSSQLDVILGVPKYKLSDIGSIISTNRTTLNDYLVHIRKEADFIDEYQHRDYVVFQGHTDIVESLRCLLFPLDLEDPRVYDCSTRSMVSIDVFRDNFVLVFISGMHSTYDETRLKKIYDDLKHSEPRIVKDIKKDDFKILWVPFVQEPDLSAADTKEKFLKMRKKMKWHVMDYTIIPDPMCKMLIRNKLNYKNNPIVPLFDPHGQLSNYNASHLLVTWGIEAFPWRKGDDVALNKKWNWLWGFLKESNPEITPWLNSDAYIIIWGRTGSKFFDDQWLKKIAGELDRIKMDNEIIRANLKEERDTVSRFWANMETTLEGLIGPNKKIIDPETYGEVVKFLELRQEHTGWVLLSKGSHVRLLGHGDIFCETLSTFDSWKGNIEKDGGFEESLLNNYEHLKSKRPKEIRCSHVQLMNPPVNIYDSIKCPHCERTMRFRSVDFVCCHGETDQDSSINNADNVSGYVKIQRTTLK